MATQQFDNCVQDTLQAKSSDFKLRDDVCDAGQVLDCSGDGDCCNASWIGDQWCDGTDQPYGCDLTCYDHNDGGVCDVCGDGICGYYEDCPEDCEVTTCESENQITCPDASCADSVGDCPVYECTEYTITVDGGGWPEEISWQLVIPPDNVISGSAPYTNNDICLPNGYYTLSLWDGNADGWSGNEFIITTDSDEKIIRLTLLEGAVGEMDFCLGGNCCLDNSAAGDACHQALYNLNLNFANADYAAINSPLGDLTPHNGIDIADPVIMIELANSIPITGCQFDLSIYPGVEIVETLVIGGVNNENEFEIFMNGSFVQVIGPIIPCINFLDSSCHTLVLVLSNENTSQNNSQETVTIRNFKVLGDIPEAGFTQDELSACDINNSQNCIAEDIFYTPNANCNQDTWLEFWPSELMGCQLTGANLEGKHFEGANLTNANLQEANLTNANLQGANLTDAILIGANLEGH